MLLLLHPYQPPTQAYGPSFTAAVLITSNITDLALFIGCFTFILFPYSVRCFTNIASMAPSQVILVLFLTLPLASILAASTNPVLKGSVTCLDCDAHNDLSEIKVLVKCSNVKKSVMASTKEDGSFETELPTDSTQTSPDSLKCILRILGGPRLLYSSKQNADSGIVKVKGHDYYTNSQPLDFYKSCPPEKYAKCAAIDSQFGSSKTVDVPLPPTWGLAPSSYYLPFIPIIGIP